MKRAIAIFSLVIAAAGTSRGQVASPATGPQTGRGATAVAPAPAITPDRTPTTPTTPPNNPVLPPPAPGTPPGPVTPPGVNTAPGQVSPPITTPGIVPGTPVPNPALPPPAGVSPVNPAINPTVPRTLPPGAGTENRSDVSPVTRRTDVPPTLLRNRTNITPAQQAQINRLTTELGIFRPGAQLSAQQRNQLMNALTAAGNTTNPVAAARLGTLADNLVSGLSGLNLTPQQRQQLAVDLNMLLYSSKLAPNETQMVIDDARNLLQSAGVNAEAVNRLASDFASITRDLQAVSSPTTSAPVQTQP